MTAAAATLALCTGVVAAHAQAALDDDDGGSPTTATTATPLAEKTNIGVGFRLRNVRIPKGLLEIFVQRAPGGSSDVGFGLEVSRRRGQFEVQLGLEYEKITVDTGIWMENGDSIPMDEVDYVQFDNFGWVTAELSFLYHTEIIPQLSVRYGGGAGIGVLTGDVLRTDYRCVDTNPDNCAESPTATNIKAPYDLPPVMLVVNAIVGVQIRPTEEIFINVEGGLRTLPFFGITAGYYF
ncbi:MAG: hypothetical protein IPL61_28510 [Myxococcales bacterium]|nr:hypothetical protein [Myxococcales bacterium]